MGHINISSSLYHKNDSKTGIETFIVLKQPVKVKMNDDSRIHIGLSGKNRTRASKEYIREEEQKISSWQRSE